MAFGLGHGGIEAVWIGVIGVLPNVLNEDSSISVVVLLSGAERFLCDGLSHFVDTGHHGRNPETTKIVLLADRSSSAWIIRLFNCISEYNPDLGCSDFWGRGCDDSFDFYKTKSGKKKGEQDNEKEYEKTGSGIRRFRDGSGKSDGMQLSGKRRK